MDKYRILLQLHNLNNFTFTHGMYGAGPGDQMCITPTTTPGHRTNVDDENF